MYLYYLLGQVSIVVVEMLESLKSSESGGGSPPKHSQERLCVFSIINTALKICTFDNLNGFHTVMCRWLF